MWERNCTWIPLTIHPCWNFWRGYGGFLVTLKEEDTLLLMVQCFNWSVLTATQTVTHTHYWINSPTLSTHSMCNYNAKHLETWNISFHSQCSPSNFTSSNVCSICCYKYQQLQDNQKFLFCTTKNFNLDQTPTQYSMITSF